jgi:hypothetical protein
MPDARYRMTAEEIEIGALNYDGEKDDDRCWTLDG